MTAPEWIYPGAEIVIYVHKYGNDAPNFHVTKVKTVAKQSFTVEQIDDRFKLDTLSTRDFGDSWRRWSYRAVPVGGEKHYELRKAASQRRAGLNAHAAMDRWLKNREDVTAIDAAIDALSALRDELTGGAL